MFFAKSGNHGRQLDGFRPRAEYEEDFLQAAYLWR
jgi:hypothetical protein